MVIKIMAWIRYRSDLAAELKDETDFYAKHRYEKETVDDILIERMILEEDDEYYQKKKGYYLSLSFEDLTLETVREKLIKQLVIQIKAMFAYMHIKDLNKVLICGLGNPNLACDCLGPLLSDQLLVNEKVALLIPRVKGQTGLDSFDIIYGTCQQYHPDLVIAVDALAAKSLSKVNHVIQLSNAGMMPGSGVGNLNKVLDSASLGIPLLCVGVPTVVDCASITYDVLNLMEDYFASQMTKPYEKLQVQKRAVDSHRLMRTQKEMLLGEVGKLSDEEKRYLLEEIIRPSNLNMIVMDKATDILIKELAKVLAHAFNLVFQVE